MDIRQEDWYKKEVKKYITRFGVVPPIYKIFPDIHPYSIGLRMGGGETAVMVFGTWFSDNYQSQDEIIDFFWEHHPPPRWLQDVAAWIWDLEPMMPEEFVELDYLEQMKELGFEGTESFLADLDDPRWR